MNNKTTTVPIKEKICFVIMPIADMDDYEIDHFNRVYKYLVKPACEQSGFKPVRADEVASSNYIIIDILQKILDSEMVLCDLSGRNPNVLYELGIRQAFNLPTILIKDIKTNKIFDIQGLRYTEYNHALRVDDVLRDTNLINQALIETEQANGTDVNSLIQLLSVKPAVRPSSVELSNDTSVILSAVKDLANRISELESGKTDESRIRIQDDVRRLRTKITKMIEPLGDGSYNINNERMDIGDEIFINGTSVGVLADVDKTGIMIKQQNDDLFKISALDPKFQRISLIPF